MKKVLIKLMSKRVKERNKKWRAITSDEVFEGYCLWCGMAGALFDDGLWGIWGHHKDGDRNNCTKSNCYPCHNACQTFIHNKNIDVRVYPNLKSYTDRSSDERS